MPARRSAWPVRRPSASIAAASPARAAARAPRRGGASVMRFTRPPSWSTMISSGAARTAAGRGIACRRRVSRRAWARVDAFSAKSTTPASSPRRMRETSAGGGVAVPRKLATSR